MEPLSIRKVEFFRIIWKPESNFVRLLLAHESLAFLFDGHKVSIKPKKLGR